MTRCLSPSRSHCLSLLFALPLLTVACALPSGVPVDEVSAVSFGNLADNPVVGWYSPAERHGLIRVTDDGAGAYKGGASLRVDFLREPEVGAGRPSVSRVVDLEGMPRRARFHLDLKGDVVGEVALVAYVWEGNVARRIAEAEATVSRDWASHAVEIDVPGEHERVGLFVYLPQAERGSLWLGAPRFDPCGD